MDKPSEASAFIAILLAFFGLSDLTAASLDALPALEYWLANVPVRLSVLFAVTAYSYLFKDDGMLGPAGGPGRYLCNALVFTWGFMELMVWFWVSCGYYFWWQMDLVADDCDFRFSSRLRRKGGLLRKRSSMLGRRRRRVRR